VLANQTDGCKRQYLTFLLDSWFIDYNFLLGQHNKKYDDFI
jgi:hypothetical protein